MKTHLRKDGDTCIELINTDSFILNKNALPDYLQDNNMKLEAIYVSEKINEVDSAIWIRPPVNNKYFHYRDQQYTCLSARSSLMTARDLIGKPYYLVIVSTPC